jgi:hypothetical protein
MDFFLKISIGNGGADPCGCPKQLLWRAQRPAPPIATFNVH